MSVSVEAIYAALAKVIDPCSVSIGTPLSMIDMGLVTGVSIDDAGGVAIELRLSSPGCMMGGFYFEPEIKKHVGVLPGVNDIRITFGDPLTWSESDITEAGRAALAATRKAKRPPQTAPACNVRSEDRHGHA